MNLSIEGDNMIQPQYNPAQIPCSSGASAVNINIYEPKAYASAPLASAAQPTQQLDSPIYNYPQGSIYQNGTPCVHPQCYPQAPMQYPSAPQAPSVPVIPVMPEPVIEKPVAQVQEPVSAPVEQEPALEQAPVKQAPTPAVETPTQPQAVIDIDRINSELTSNDLNQHTETITKIAQMAQEEPSIALQLVQTQMMQNLAAIVANDTTQLPGPTNAQIAAAQKLQGGKQITPQEQQLLEQSSPKEIAEKNKAYAMYTLAILQKLQRDEVDQFNAQQGNSVVPVPQIQDLTGYKEIAATIESSQIPAVKAAGIQSISYVARPQDAQSLQQFLAPYAADKDPLIKQTAQEAIAKMLGAPVAQEAEQTA